jgi:hypothetical protein
MIVAAAGRVVKVVPCCRPPSLSLSLSVLLGMLPPTLIEEKKNIIRQHLAPVYDTTRIIPPDVVALEM